MTYLFKNTLVVAALITLSSAALATTYQCGIVNAAPGNPSFILILNNGLPGQESQGVILSQNMSTGTSAWTLVDGNAQVSLTPDGGPTRIGSVEKETDWTKNDSCYGNVNEGYRFSLTERTNGVSGSVTSYRHLQMNPNKKGNECPRIEPYQDPTYKITCKTI